MIEKLEPGPEINARIETEVMGNRPDGKARFPGCNEPEPYVMRDRFPVPWIPKSYSTDIAAAWEVLSMLYRDGPYKKGWSPSLARQNDGQWVCTLHNHGYDTIPTGVAETAPLAICLAALAAVGGK